MAAEAIRRKQVICRLTPLSIALGVLPIAQLALHLYVKYHAPSLRPGADLAAISAAISFMPAGVFNPVVALRPFRKALYETESAMIEYDVSASYANIVKALCRVQYEELDIYEHDDHRPTRTWKGFVNATRKSLERRREYHGSRLHYSEGELASLLDNVRDFADEWQKLKAGDS